MDIKETYNKLVRPGFVDNIRRTGIDAVFTSASGNYLYYDDKKVFDFISGYGTGLMGHNHPRLIKVAKDALDSNIVFQGQRSVRKNAAILADKLNRQMKQSTNYSYVFQFANSGAEANEIALKHAFMEKKIADNVLWEKAETAEKVVLTMEDGAEKEKLKECINDTRKILSASKILVGLVDGFHGKTTGTLKLSYASNISFMVEYLGINSLYVIPNDLQDLEQKTKEIEQTIYDFDIVGTDVKARAVPYTPIIALFAEPILGDGGVVELGSKFAKAMRAVCDKWNVPLIFDEIQCGMGRTGRFLASEYLNVFADYYCFSKALGGAISKNSVCAIKENRFIKQFGFIHSSTFNEDDYSCRISYEFLDMLFENDYEIIKTCELKGHQIHNALIEIQNKYPEFILEVRGKGLMQGFVIDNALNSKLSKYTDVQYINLVEGYLFKYGFRVGTTLTSGAVIRLEPSFTISEEEIKELSTVLSELGTLIQNEEFERLVEEVVTNES